MRKILIALLIISTLITTSCTKKEIDDQKGTIDNYTYEETTEKTNYAKIKMQDGKIILVELYPNEAPITVANFQKLISEKFYDNLTFHRIAPGFVIQGGDPKGDGTGGSEEKIVGEFRRNGYTNKIKHERGILSMARGNDMNSASSQFFICLNDSTAENLDGSYASFGKVIAGMSTVDSIASTKLVENTADTPVEKPVIESIRFVNVSSK